MFLETIITIIFIITDNLIILVIIYSGYKLKIFDVGKIYQRINKIESLFKELHSHVNIWTLH